MYVAITRARQRLYLSFAQTRMLHGQTRYSIRSRFIGELPEGDLKWLSAAPGSRSGGWGQDSGWQGGARQGGGQRGGQRGGWQTGSGRSVDAGTRPSRSDTALAQRYSRDSRFRVGQTVAHRKFGEGVILAMEGGGEDLRVQVNFGGAGTKWLALSIAKLDPVN